MSYKWFSVLWISGSVHEHQANISQNVTVATQVVGLFLNYNTKYYLVWQARVRCGVRPTKNTKNAGDEKILHLGSRKFIFLINLIKFLNIFLQLENYSNSTFPCKKQGVRPSIFWGEKTAVIRNKFVSGKLP